MSLRENFHSFLYMELIRKILDNLSPENFETSIKQIKELTFDTLQKLEGLINLIYEKAVTEPSFCFPCAALCRHLALIKAPLDDGQNMVNFRKLLLTKCQKEFEQYISSEKKYEDKIAAMEASKDDEEKFKQLQLELEKEKKTAKIRRLGNIRLIGELLKLNMLIDHIIHECIKKLLAQGDEESLECLCCLFETVGKVLDERPSKNQNTDLMDSYFITMQGIVDERLTSSKIKFMLQDVIDLRKNAWIPRRNGNNPKTTDQMLNEAEKEAFEDQ